MRRITNIQFHCRLTVERSLKFGWRSPIFGGSWEVTFIYCRKILKKTPMRKDEKNMHSKFHCNLTNISSFKIGVTNFRGTVHMGGGSIFFNSKKKTAMAKDEKRSFIMIRWMEFGLKSGEPIVEEAEEQEPILYAIFGHFSSAVTFF